MKRFHQLLFRLLTCFAILLLLASTSNAQFHNKPIKKKKKDSFKKDQWYLGLRGGMNWCTANPGERYADFIDIQANLNAELPDQKEYGGFNDNVGAQAGLSLIYAYSSDLQISLQAMFSHMKYTYTRFYEWTDAENGNNTVSFQYDHEVGVNYLELPLIVRYSFGNGRLKPHLLGGGYYGYFISARKSVFTTGVDEASGGVNEFSQGEQSTDANKLFIRSNLGWLAGAGAEYNLGNVVFVLDIAYRQGVNNIVSEKNRYSATRQFTGFGNVQDNLSLNNITTNVSIVFPLKFFTRDYNPVML